MPISNNATYVTTINEFLSHWDRVNTAINPKILTLAGGYARADLNTDGNAIATQLTLITTDQTTYTQARSNLLAAKKSFNLRLRQFRDAVQTRLPNSSYVAALPTVPNISSIESRFLRPFDAMSILWTQINATPPPGFTGPLLLPGNYNITTFQTELGLFRNQFLTFAAQQGTVRGDLRKRDLLFHDVRQRLKQYRTAVPSLIMPPNALLNDIPRLSPPKGATPNPVTNLRLTYDTTQNRAKIVYTPSTSANLKFYELRFSPGPKWNAQDAVTVASHYPENPAEFEFTLDMVDVGETALFKIYTINETENERGSKIESVKRLTATLQLAA